MESLAVLRVMEYIQVGAYVVKETDSPMCIHSLTKYRKRWEKNGWRKDDGPEAEMNK
jgi:ribonuclease HI